MLSTLVTLLPTLVALLMFLILLILFHKTLEFFIEYCEDSGPTVQKALWSVHLIVKIIEFPFGLFALLLLFSSFCVLTLLQAFVLVLMNIVVHPLGLLSLIVVTYTFCA